MPVISDNKDLFERLTNQLRAEVIDTDEVRLCLWAVAEIKGNCELYDSVLLADTVFSSQLTKQLEAALQSHEYFGLLETLILFCREKVLRRPDLPESAMESALFAYFAHSGEWEFSDGTLLVDWFYVRMPALVLSHLQQQ
ncbi:hypothetical protein [Oleidesulfovibrio sp.]|uniref:hypothetical protein n=1 Tax=Oleidesulfovibrio sp. TaxID=2909707 RepID=UPI003A84A41B